MRAVTDNGGGFKRRPPGNKEVPGPYMADLPRFIDHILDITKSWALAAVEVKRALAIDGEAVVVKRAVMFNGLQAILMKIGWMAQTSQKLKSSRVPL